MLLAAASLALLLTSFLSAHARFEQTLLNRQSTEVDRFIRRTLTEFQFEVDASAVGADRLLSNAQQRTLIERLYETHVDELRALSFVHAVPQTTGVPEGQETARCVISSETEQEFICAHDASGEGIPDLRNRLEEPFYRETITRGLYISDIMWGSGTVPLVEFGIPIVLEEGGERFVLTIVTGELDISRLQEIFAGSGFAKSGTVLMTDSEGRVLAHSAGPQYLRRDASALLTLMLQDALMREQFPISSLYGLAFEEGVGYSSISSLDFGATQWFLIAEWPVGDAFLELLLIGMQFLVVGLLLLVVVNFIGRRLAQDIVSPIRTIQQKASAIGKGDFGERINLQTGDELDDLGDSLNQMAEDLRKLQQVREADTRAQALATAVAKEHELEEEKGTLLETASHQFRTPITALHWNIDILRTRPLGKEDKELIEGIAEHTENLATIAGDLLNATAFGAGYRAQPDSGPVSLRGTLASALDRFRSRIEKKRLTLQEEFPYPDVVLRASATTLRIALEHVFENAVTYTDEGGMIELSVLFDAERREATIVIKDNGIGIPEDEQKHLFDAFFRAKNAITKKNVGTGLGLYIANNVVEGHGGSLEIVSEEGKGCEVRMILPSAAVLTQENSAE